MVGLDDFPRFPNKFISLKKAKQLGYTSPSNWVSASKLMENGGNPDGYGVRPEGAYIVDLPKDEIIPFEFETLSQLKSLEIDNNKLNDYLGDDIFQRISLVTIASSASPGGLKIKEKKGFANGKYVVLPCNIVNEDIVMGNLGKAVYSIAVPTVSQRTEVRGNIVLLTNKQMEGMSASEFRSGNYTVVGGTKAKILNSNGDEIETISSLGFEGEEACFKTNQGDVLAFKGIPAKNRKYPQSTLFTYYDEICKALNIYSDGIEVKGNIFHPKNADAFFSELRTNYEYERKLNSQGKNVDFYSRDVINKLKKELKHKGNIVETNLSELGLVTVLDPYIRDENGEVVFDKQTKLSQTISYSPEIYSDYRLENVV